MKKPMPLIFALMVLLLTTSVIAGTEDPAATPSSNPHSGMQPNIITAVGDINFNSIEGLIIPNPNYPWAGINDILKKATILVGNQEVPFSNRGSIYVEKTWKLRSDPRTVQALVAAGFDVVTLANNHIMDFGPIALQDTLAALDNAKIGWTGAGMNLNEARQPVIITAPDGTRFAFLAYSLVYPEIFWANSARPGTPYGDPAIFVPDIKKAKTIADHVIVSFHWSDELHYYPSDYQKIYGRLCIDNGASVVLGHHPHVLQGIEVYKGGLIAYSLGNFVFGSYSARVKDSIILEIECDKTGLSQARIYPINVFNKEVQFQPKLRQGADAERVLNNLRTYSSQFKTGIESHGNTGIIKIQK